MIQYTKYRNSAPDAYRDDYCYSCFQVYLYLGELL